MIFLFSYLIVLFFSSCMVSTTKNALLYPSTPLLTILDYNRKLNAIEKNTYVFSQMNQILLPPISLEFEKLFNMIMQMKSEQHEGDISANYLWKNRKYNAMPKFFLSPKTMQEQAMFQEQFLIFKRKARDTRIAVQKTQSIAKNQVLVLTKFHDIHTGEDEWKMILLILKAKIWKISNILNVKDKETFQNLISLLSKNKHAKIQT